MHFFFFKEFKLSHCISHANHGHVLMSPRRPTVEGKFKFVTAKRKSHGAISTFEMLCFLRSIQYRTAAAPHSLHCSKIDMQIQDGELDCASWKTAAKKNPHQFVAHCIKLLRMCVRAWKTEEERSLGLPWPTSLPSPLRCLFLCGAVSLPGVGSAPPR